MVSNRTTTSSGPVPMDVSEVEIYPYLDEYCQEKDDVGALGVHIQCHKCSG